VIAKLWLFASIKTNWIYSQSADVMMLNGVKAYLVACFRWRMPCCKQHTEVFPLRSAR